jgi:colanic acid/amylovoran biosynthesis glycosyltransferase
MRIAYFIGGFPALSETFILDQMIALQAQGHTIEVLALWGSSGSRMHAEVARSGLLKHVRYFKPFRQKRMKEYIHFFRLAVRILKNDLRVFLRLLFLFNYCRRNFNYNIFYPAAALMDKPCFDIIICHYGQNGSIAVILREIELLSGKIVTVFHGHDLRCVKLPGKEKMYELLFKKGDLFLALSEFHKKFLLDLGAPMHKVVHLAIGINLGNFSFRAPREGRMGFRLLTVARLVGEKSLHIALQAVAKLIRSNSAADITYTIVGDGPVRSNLEQRIMELGLTGKAILVGARTREEIKAYFQDSDVFLLSSTHEGLPVVLMEAEAVGLPIVATNIAGIPEIVADGQSGFLVSANDIDSLAEKLEYLFEHRDSWEELAQRGRKIVEDKYDSSKLGRRLTEILQELSQN